MESLQGDKALQGIKSVSQVIDREMNRNDKILPALYRSEIQVNLIVRQFWDEIVSILSSVILPNRAFRFSAEHLISGLETR